MDALKKGVIIFYGTTSDLYEQIDLLVRRMGYKLITEAMTERSLDSIEDVTDIVSGDFIIYRSIDGAYAVLVADKEINNQGYTRKVLSALGVILGLQGSNGVDLSKVDLNSNRNREEYHKEMKNLENTRTVLERSVEKVLWVPAKPEQMIGLHTFARQELGYGPVPVINVYDQTEHFVGDDLSESHLFDGSFFMGQAGNGGVMDQLLMIGHALTEDAIRKYVREMTLHMGLGTADTIEVSVSTESFDDFMSHIKNAPKDLQF